LVDNLSRLNEGEESDRQGVFHILGIFNHFHQFSFSLPEGIFENVLGFNPQLSSKLVSKTRIMNWLLDRIQPKTHDENRGYAAELLPILLQDNQANRLELGKQDGVETILKVLSVCRRPTPDSFIYPLYSNTAGETLSTLMKQNSWRTHLMHYVLLWPSLPSRAYSLPVKVLI
jgi:beta-catenin-like protein 1